MWCLNILYFSICKHFFLFCFPVGWEVMNNKFPKRYHATLLPGIMGVTLRAIETGMLENAQLSKHRFCLGRFGLLRVRSDAKLIGEDFPPWVLPKNVQKSHFSDFSFIKNLIFRKLMKHIEFCYSDIPKTQKMIWRTRCTKNH